MNSYIIEEKYIKTYCKTKSLLNNIVYYDDYCYDKYMHNFIYLKKYTLKTIEDYIDIYKNNKSFIEFKLDYFDSQIFDSFKPIEIDHEVAYHALIKDIKISKVLENKVVRELNINDEQMLLDWLYLGSVKSGVEYSKKNSLNYVDKALHKKLTDFYAIFDNSEIVGSIEVFKYKNAIKVEDFFIADDYQKKGYGSTLLNKVLNDAIENKFKYVYLIADYNDTPKLMYEKIGFKYAYDFFYLRKEFK